METIPKKKNGGRRPGSGRKKASHTLEAALAREILVKELVKEVVPIAQALMKKAKKGDTLAIKEYFDRLFGKAVQPLTGQDDEGNIVPITAINVVPIQATNLK